MIRTKISLQAAPSENKGAADGEIPPWVIAGAPSNGGQSFGKSGSEEASGKPDGPSEGAVVNVKQENQGQLSRSTTPVVTTKSLTTAPIGVTTALENQPESLPLPSDSEKKPYHCPPEPPDSLTTAQTQPDSQSQSLTIQEGKTPPWLIKLRGYYETMIASITGGKKDAGPTEWERIYSLYLDEICKELERRKAVGDRQGYVQAYRMWQAIHEALIATMRLQVEELIKRQFKGERLAAEHFPAGDPPANKRELFERWEKTFIGVTQALDQLGDRILQHDPTYTFALDWPAESWFKAEGIPEGLWK